MPVSPMMRTGGVSSSAAIWRAWSSTSRMDGDSPMTPASGVSRAAPPAVIGELLAELGVLPGAVGQELELLEVERLLEVVERPELHRLDGALDGAVGGHDDHRDGGVELADPPEQVDASMPGSRTSVKTTSGRSVSSRRSACSASPATSAS